MQMAELSETSISEDGWAYIEQYHAFKKLDVLEVGGSELATLDCMILGGVDQRENGEDQGLSSKMLRFEGAFAFASQQSSHQEKHNHDRNRRLEHYTSEHNHRWQTPVVPFEFKSGLFGLAKQQVEAGMWYWMQATEIRFIPRTDEADYIEFEPADFRCSSHVGRVGGSQKILVDKEGLCLTGAIMHELGHALGYLHEHTRPDRDAFVAVQEGNIREGYAHNFDKADPDYSHFGLLSGASYDYASIMHYAADNFVRRPGDDGEEEGGGAGAEGDDGGAAAAATTLLPLPGPYAAYRQLHPRYHMGQRVVLTEQDRALAAAMHAEGAPHCEANYAAAVAAAGDGEGGDMGVVAGNWTAGPWGGVVPTCGLGAYRTRPVACVAAAAAAAAADGSAGGAPSPLCLPARACDPDSRPESVQQMDLVLGLEGEQLSSITFDMLGTEAQNYSLASITGPLSNNLVHDEFDWLPWQPNYHNFSKTNIDDLPLTDGSGDPNGRFLYFAPPLSSPVASQGDEAWLETPVLNTEGVEPCTVSFKYYLHGGAELDAQRAGCDCAAGLLWRGRRGTRGGWVERALALAPAAAPARLRLVGRAGGAHGGAGLDDVRFSAGCHWTPPSGGGGGGGGEAAAAAGGPLPPWEPGLARDRAGDPVPADYLECRYREPFDLFATKNIVWTFFAISCCCLLSVATKIILLVTKGRMGATQKLKSAPKEEAEAPPPSPTASPSAGSHNVALAEEAPSGATWAAPRASPAGGGAGSPPGGGLARFFAPGVATLASAAAGGGGAAPPAREGGRRRRPPRRRSSLRGRRGSVAPSPAPSRRGSLLTDALEGLGRPRGYSEALSEALEGLGRPRGYSALAEEEEEPEVEEIRL